MPPHLLFWAEVADQDAANDLLAFLIGMRVVALEVGRRAAAGANVFSPHTLKIEQFNLLV
jgi:hypothetical protein